MALAAMVWAGGAAGQALDVKGPAGSKSWSAGEIAALPHQSATLAGEGGAAPRTLMGVPLATLLGPVSGLAGPRVGGKALRLVIAVDGADGYRAVFSIADLDPSLSPLRLVLADRDEHGPMGAKEGPLRLVVEGDRRPGRSVRMVTAMGIEAAP
jgi:hypothetical protein